MRVLRSLPSVTRAIGATMVAAAVVAGCSSSAGAGWTYAPQPSVTPAPSGSAVPSSSAGPSAAPSFSATAAPGSSASAAPSTPASGSPSTGTVVNETAEGIAFKDTQLNAPAGQAFTIDFNNQDSGIPHNIQIKDAAGASVFKGDIVTGPVQTSYKVDALAAGTYSFICDVHPTSMTGTLTVK
jgi:plastocyanin